MPRRRHPDMPATKASFMPSEPPVSVAAGIAAAGISRRRLGELESLFHWSSRRYQAFTLCAAVRLRGRIPARALQEAVRRAILQDPYLTSTLGDGWRPEIRLSSAEPPVSVIPRTSDTMWQRWMEDEVNRPVRQGSGGTHLGQCRAVILHGTTDHEIVITVNHAVCDGESLKGLVARILRQCPEPDAEGRHPAGSLAPPFDRTRSIRQWAASVSAFVRQSIVSCQSRGASSGGAEQPRADEGDHTFLSFVTLTPGDSARLFESCRAQGLKVTSVLAAAALMSMIQCGLSRDTMNFQLNIDHRRRDGRLHALAGGVASFWEVMRVDVAKDSQLRSLAASMNRLNALAVRRNVVPPYGYGRIACCFMRLLGGRRFSTSDVMLSNLGRIPAWASGENVNMTELRVATSQNSCGSDCGVIATTVSGALSLTVMTRRTIGDDRRRQLARTIEANLLQFGSAGCDAVADVP